jgi:hypothetical protein
MIFVATGLILLGVVTALAGLKLFRLLLPLVGFVSGLMVGFGGVQAVFGTGAASTTVAVLMALITGAVMALLSFLFFEVAIIVLSIVLGMSAYSYLAVAMGLGENGFILFMLTLSGAILGFVVATTGRLSRSLVVVLTSFLGVTFVLGGAMLLVGSVSLNQLNDGIVRTVLSVVDQEFVWLLVWLGGGFTAVTIQNATPDLVMATDAYEYKEVKRK